MENTLYLRDIIDKLLEKIVAESSASIPRATGVGVGNVFASFFFGVSLGLLREKCMCCYAFCAFPLRTRAKQCVSWLGPVLIVGWFFFLLSVCSFLTPWVVSFSEGEKKKDSTPPFFFFAWWLFVEEGKCSRKLLLSTEPWIWALN